MQALTHKNESGGKERLLLQRRQQQLVMVAIVVQVHLLQDIPCHRMKRSNEMWNEYTSYKGEMN